MGGPSGRWWRAGMVAAVLVAGLALLVVRAPDVAGQAIATATPMPVPTGLLASSATVAGVVPGTTMTPMPAPWLTETTTATVLASVTASPVLPPSVSATATMVACLAEDAEDPEDPVRVRRP